MSEAQSFNPDLRILEQIEHQPDTTQANLAVQMGVAVGTINWHLKRLVEKGYIKVKRAERKKLRYLITPEGIALRARLTLDYINSQLHLYRLVRERALKAADDLLSKNIGKVNLQGEGEVAEICRLTFLEKGIDPNGDFSAATVQVIGLKIFTNPEDIPETWKTT